MLERFLKRLVTWLLRHRALVLALWLVPLPVLVVSYLGVNRRLKSKVDTNRTAQSTVVSQKRAAGFPKQSEFTTLVTFHDDRLTADDAPFADSVTRVNAAAAGLGCVARSVSWPGMPVRSFFVSKDGHTQVTVVELRARSGEYTQAEQCVRKLRETIADLRSELALPRLEVLVTGTSAFEVDIGAIVQRDSSRAELWVFLVSLILLVWMFRSAAASLLPLITAALAVLSTLGVIYLMTYFTKLSIFVSTVTSMSGLALGLDYALLYVNRVREEMTAGQGSNDAIVKAGHTAGKAILGSGTLVMLGFLGLFIPDLGISRSLAFSGVLIVFFTLLATLTLLPVLLSLWRPVMDWPRWRWFRASHAAVDRFWVRWADFVIRHPLIPLLLALGLVGTFAPHLLDLRVKNSRHEVIPRRVEARRGVERVIEVAGEGQVYPVTCVAEITDGGTWEAPRRQRFLIDRLNEIRAFPSVDVVRGPDLLMNLGVTLFGKRVGFGFGDGFAGRFLSTDRRMVSFDIHARDASDRGLDALVAKLRRELPRRFGVDPAIRVWVGGAPATTYETKRHLVGSLPLMIPVVILAAFLVMSLFFRSVVIPLKAVILNVLSLSTTYGILVLVFQHGYGLSWLGYSGAPPGALSLLTPVVLFCVLFGVSMDYEVFLVSRVKESFLESGGAEAGGEARERIHRAAIHEGLSRTGGIISNAALIMVLTFGAFVSGVLLPMKEIGFALALAVGLDATLVRMMLVPAILRLVGSRTWWFPGR